MSGLNPTMMGGILGAISPAFTGYQSVRQSGAAAAQNARAAYSQAQAYAAQGVSTSKYTGLANAYARPIADPSPESWEAIEDAKDAELAAWIKSLRL